MSFTDTALVVGIVLFLVLIIWSRVMDQRMYDTVIEIRDMIKDIAK